MKPGGILKLRSPRNWSPSSRSSFRWKSLKAPASGFEVPATRRGLKGRIWPGRACRSGPELSPKIGRRVAGRRARCSRGRSRFDACRSCSASGRHQRPVRGEEVEVEAFERHLRQVVEVRRHLARLRIGVDRADQLRVDAEAVGDQEEPVLVAGLRFADVDRAEQRPVEGRRVDLEGADLRVVRAIRRRLGAEVGLRVGAGRLAVGGVGVDRQPVGQGHGRRPDLGRRDGEALELFGVPARGRARTASRFRWWSAPALRTGLKFSFSQPVIGGNWRASVG